MEANNPKVAKFLKDTYTGSELEKLHFIIKRTPNMATRLIRGTNRLDYTTCKQLMEYDISRFHFSALKCENPEMFDLSVLELVELEQLETELKNK